VIRLRSGDEPLPDGRIRAGGAVYTEEELAEDDARDLPEDPEISIFERREES
jgi:hypothetical protein